MCACAAGGAAAAVPAGSCVCGVWWGPLGMPTHPKQEEADEFLFPTYYQCYRSMLIYIYIIIYNIKYYFKFLIQLSP
jgi:hypothetical protein